MTTNNATVLAPKVPNHPVFQGAIFSILTDENPRFPRSGVALEKSLQEYLDANQTPYEPVRGRYGGSDENSFIVYANSLFCGVLGEMYGQESIISSSGGQNQLRYTNGPNAGRYHPGQGFLTFPEAPADYFSTLETPEGPVYFQLGINFDELHPA